MDSVLEVFKYNSHVFKINLDGISNEESLIKGADNTNPINWIAGHVTLSRDSLLEALGRKKMCGEEYKEYYERGTSMLDPAKSIDLQTLMEQFNKAGKVIGEELEKTTDPEKLKKAAFFMFHEAYHMGQLGVLRKLIGKEGMIK